MQDKLRMTQSDIGVVCPYKLQCKILRSHLEKLGLKDVSMGTAEAFQGQERKVMIISTVRSGGTLGNFLKNPQVCQIFQKRNLKFLPIKWSLFAEIQCNDNPREKPLDCSRESSYSVPRWELGDIYEILHWEQKFHSEPEILSPRPKTFELISNEKFSFPIFRNKTLR